MYMYICICMYVNVCTYIWVLIKIRVSGAATIADQPRINRGPSGVNRGRVLSYATLLCAKDCQNMSKHCYILQYLETCLSQSRTNRRSIAMQGFAIADVEIHMPFHNS